MKLFIVSILAISFCSCSIFDEKTIQDYTICVSGATIASTIRQDKNPPEREQAYIASCVIIEEYIASGGTDSQTLRKELEKTLSLVFSKSLTDKVVGAIMDSIEKQIAKNPEDVANALNFALSSIKCGIEMSHSSK